MKFDCFFEYDTYGRTRGDSLKPKKKRFYIELRQHFFTDKVVECPVIDEVSVSELFQERT